MDTDTTEELYLLTTAIQNIDITINHILISLKYNMTMTLNMLHTTRISDTLHQYITTEWFMI